MLTISRLSELLSYFGNIFLYNNNNKCIILLSLIENRQNLVNNKLVKLTLLGILAAAILMIAPAGRAGASPEISQAIPNAAVNAKYCTAGGQIPLIKGISTKYNTPTTNITDWYCSQGHGLGEIMLAIHTSQIAGSVSTKDVLASRDLGKSWDQIWQELNLIHASALAFTPELTKKGNKHINSAILLFAGFSIFAKLICVGKSKLAASINHARSLVGRSKLNPTGPPKSIFNSILNNDNNLKPIHSKEWVFSVYITVVEGATF